MFVLFRPSGSEGILIFFKASVLRSIYQLLTFFSFWIFQPLPAGSLLSFSLQYCHVVRAGAPAARQCANCLAGTVSLRVETPLSSRCKWEHSLRGVKWLVEVTQHREFQSWDSDLSVAGNICLFHLPAVSQMSWDENLRKSQHKVLSYGLEAFIVLQCNVLFLIWVLGTQALFH